MFFPFKIQIQSKSFHARIVIEILIFLLEKKIRILAKPFCFPSLLVHIWNTLKILIVFDFVKNNIWGKWIWIRSCFNWEIIIYGNKNWFGKGFSLGIKKELILEKRICYKIWWSNCFWGWWVVTCCKIYKVIFQIF